MLRLLREASISERFELLDTLTQSAFVLSRRALTRRRPHATNLEILLEWVGLHYGGELEAEVRAYIQSRRMD